MSRFVVVLWILGVVALGLVLMLVLGLQRVEKDGRNEDGASQPRAALAR